MAMPRLALPDHGAIGDIERGKKRSRPVTHIVVCKGAGSAFPQRQTRLSAVQSLHLALLVAAEYHRMFRSIQIEPNNVLQFLGKVGVVGNFKGTTQMRFEAVLLPDATDSRRTKPGFPK